MVRTLENNYFLVKKLFFGENNLNDPEVFIVFKLTELSRNCSK